MTHNLASRLVGRAQRFLGRIGPRSRRTSSARRRIVVLSGISASNLGDDAMLVATVRDLRHLDPEVQITVLAEDPARCRPVAAQIDVPIVPSLQLFVQSFLAEVSDGAEALAVRWWADEIHRNRAAILRGERPSWLTSDQAFGLQNLLAAEGVVDCGGASLGVHWKSYFYEKCLDYLVAPRPLFISGQGVDPLDLPEDRRLLLDALSRAAEITLREPISERYLRSLGCGGFMRTTGDDTLTLGASSPARCRELVQDAGTDPAHPFLAFQYRHYLDYEEDRFFDVVAALVDAALEATGLDVVSVPMHFGGMDERDHLDELGRRLSRGRRFHVIKPQLTPSEAMSVFGAAEAGFGFSYHSGVFALSGGTPYLGLHRGAHYGQKMQGLAELYGVPELPAPLDDMTPKTFAHRLLALLERRDAIGRHLTERHADLAQEVRESRRRFLERIASMGTARTRS